MSTQYCETHDLIVAAGTVCPACAAVEQRHTITMHQARIADLENRLLRTNRIVVELVKRIQRDQKAHNALARHSEQLLTRVEQALAHIQREHAAAQAIHTNLFIVDCACGFHLESLAPIDHRFCPHCGASETP